MESAPKPQQHPRERNLANRATSILQSRVPLTQEIRGKVRVARNQLNLKPTSNPVPITHSRLPMAVKQGGLENVAIKLVPKRSDLVEPYIYIPPAATRYFLWNSDRTGQPLMIIPSFVILCNKIILTEESVKALKISFLKRRLLIKASTILDLKDLVVTGSWSFEELLLDGVGLDQSVTVSDLFSYKALLKYFKSSIESESIGAKLPMIALFDTDGVERTQYWTVIPNFTFQIHPIHSLRLVKTTLSLQVMTGSSSIACGFMSIDQKRQLYLRDDKNDGYPMIGMWFQLDDVMDPIIVIASLRYILNDSIIKLDTGKKQWLVCLFTKEDPSRPQCYECSYIVTVV